MKLSEKEEERVREKNFKLFVLTCDVNKMKCFDH